MSDNSDIEWTDATWSVVTGCTRVSPGCDNCYIERTPPFRMQHRRFDKPGVGGTTGVKLHSDRLHWPLKWRKPKRVFVCSLADLFHERVPDRFIAETFAVMAMARQHVFQVLSKRHARMRSLLGFAKTNGFHDDMVAALFARGYSGGIEWPLPNVWLGCSAENQQWADIRIPALLETPAAVRWVSAEPLLGALNLSRYMSGSDYHAPWNYTEFGAECMCRAAIDKDDRCTAPGLDWTVVGGESGPGSRPMDEAWVRSIVEQCRDAGVPAFVKQLGSVWAKEHDPYGPKKGGEPEAWPEDLRVREYPNSEGSAR